MKTSCGNEDTGQLCGVNSVHNQLLYVLKLTPTKGVVKDLDSRCMCVHVASQSSALRLGCCGSGIRRLLSCSRSHEHCIESGCLEMAVLLVLRERDLKSIQLLRQVGEILQSFPTVVTSLIT